MKRLARFFDLFPEAQRELYALPRWWIMLFGLLAVIPFASVVVSDNPAFGAAFDTLDSLFALAFLLCCPFSFFSGLQLSTRILPGQTPRKAPALLLAAMIHTYLCLLALLPFVIGSVLYGWDLELAWQSLIMLLRLELGSLLFAAVGLLCGVYQKDLPPLTAAVFYAVAVLYILLTLFGGPASYNPWDACLPLAGIEANCEPLEIGPHGEPAANRFRISMGPAWLAGGLQQLLLLLAGLTMLDDALKAGMRAIMRKRTHLLLLFTVSVIAFPLALLSLSGLEEYLTVAGVFLILSTPFLVPPHRELRQRFLNSQRGISQWLRAEAPAYGWLLFSTFLICWPAAAHSFVFTHSGVARCVFLTACTFWVWCCFIASLVEHCELYVPDRGRLLAVLVSAIFLIVPSLLGEHYLMPEALRYIHPFMGLELFTYQPGNQEVIAPTVDFFYVFLHIGVVGLAAFAMHLWNDLQRRRLAKAMQSRIRDAFAAAPTDDLQRN